MLLVLIIYRVGQKSKLLILSEYVNKTEKIGGTHTHPFNGPLSRKAKQNLDFTEARDSEWQWHQLGQDALPVAQPTASKH